MYELMSHSLTEGFNLMYQSSIFLHCRINLDNMLTAMWYDFLNIPLSMKFSTSCPCLT